MIAQLTYYERWIGAFADILFRKGIRTLGELARKMEEVEGAGGMTIRVRRERTRLA
jgi:hypothetical protein